MTDPFAWRNKGAAGRVISALNEKGEARFVGGCVRDSLIGLPPGPAGRTDIDVATTLLPEETQSCLQAEGIKTIPTGLDHGTVTAVVDHIPIEVTTLRADISTDGRRATVAFTRDWELDAARRDFTINAMFLTAGGEVIDLVGGREDLAARRVRFIGDAEDRIREDALRILRFMRFSARFAGALDEAGWQACISHRAKILTLSKERIWQETSCTFPQCHASRVFAAAAEADILAEIVAAPADIDLFSAVHGLDREAMTPALGIAALWPEADRALLKNAFKPPTYILDQVAEIRAAASGQFDSRHGQQETLFRYGREVALAGLQLWCAGQSRADFDGLRDAIEKLSIPRFPLSGADFVGLGVMPGPGVGQALKKAERLWIARDFPTDQEAIDEIKRAAIAGPA
ncbi:MAG: CCA tRNA nucleotidyltransferase [Parvularcula sp.]